MIEIPVLSSENIAVNPGEKKLPGKSLPADRSSSKDGFSRRLQNLKQKKAEGSDHQNTIDAGKEVGQEKRSALSRGAMPIDYIIPNLILAGGAVIESEVPQEIDQDLKVGVLLEMEEVTAGGLENSTEHVPQSNPGSVMETSLSEPNRADNSTGQNSLVGGQSSGQIVSPEIITAAASTAAADVNAQKVQLTQAADIEAVSDSQEDADNAEKQTGFKNIITNHKTDSAKVGAKTSDDDKSKMPVEASDSKARNDQSDVKKLIYFEAHRMKANKLPAAVKADNQEPGTDSQTMNDKTQVLDIKMAKTDVHFQDQIRSPINPKEVLEQIVDKIEIIQSKKLSELTLELKPDFLGKMTIKIAMEEGGLTARFVTESLHVKNLLESNLNSLKQTLESNGIKVEKTEVNVQLNNGGMFDGSEGNQQDRWQNPGYFNQAWHYIEESLVEGELPEQAETIPLNYADGELTGEMSMNFLV
ncbi:flagellar hook-length control protein flik [hydrocarbon metagenome]|uniref:Flagellar hook-length control protein flik n=1 Tax=hydrocarbon metagenome TaxID=938273 RepID=A0A0W8E4L7_9ZZZZ